MLGHNMCVGVCMTEVSDSILPCSLDKSQCSRHLEVNLTQASRHPAEEHLHLHQSKVSNFIVPSQLLLIQNLTWCILEDIVENLFLWEFLYWEYSLWISIENPLKSLNHCLRVWPTSNQGWLWISSLSAMENALEMWVKCRHLMLMLMPWKCEWNVDTLCFAPGGDGWQGWRWLWLGRRAGAPQGLQITSCCAESYGIWLSKFWIYNVLGRNVSWQVEPKPLPYVHLMGGQGDRCGGVRNTCTGASIEVFFWFPSITRAAPRTGKCLSVSVRVCHRNLNVSASKEWVKKLSKKMVVKGGGQCSLGCSLRWAVAFWCRSCEGSFSIFYN